MWFLGSCLLGDVDFGTSFAWGFAWGGFAWVCGDRGPDDKVDFANLDVRSFC